MHKGAFYPFSFRWIHYYGSNKSTGLETGKSHLCALQDFIRKTLVAAAFVPTFTRQVASQELRPDLDCVLIRGNKHLSKNFENLLISKSTHHFCPLNYYILRIQWLWQYRLWSFQGRDTKLEEFLAKNQLQSNEIIKFENWGSGELSKIGHHFRK